MKMISTAAESESVAKSVNSSDGVYVVPAFVGLGAPYWDQYARGTIVGLTRGSGRAQIVRATLESIAYQTRDVLEAMQADWGEAGDTVLRVDGGMVASDWTMQYLADILDAPVDRPTILETTALGVAWLAGARAGVWPDQAGFANTWARDKRFEPNMDVGTRDKRYAGWKDAVKRTLSS